MTQMARPPGRRVSPLMHASAASLSDRPLEINLKLAVGATDSSTTAVGVELAPAPARRLPVRPSSLAWRGDGGALYRYRTLSGLGIAV